MIRLSPVSTADLRPLDESDFTRLDALLDQTGDDNAMVVEEVDGFLAALACVPDPIDEDALLAQVLGAEPFDEEASPADRASQASLLETHAEIGALLRRHAARVVATLDAGEFGPVLAYDEDGNADGIAWAVGFLRGVELHPDSWDAMLAEKDFGDALDTMASLAAAIGDEDEGEGEGEEDAAQAAKERSGAERDELIDRMIADVADIHEFFRPWREAGTTPAAMRVETVRRSGPKIGRNDPCPCGSGRKYKNCCGGVKGEG
ncbi:MAG: UPF0149 family protein [Burkholderiaceae bacterium]|nr:UPF0149 family protein [Burkholderiaceae bacterium]